MNILYMIDKNSIDIQNLKKILTCSAYHKKWSAQKNKDRQKYKLHKQSL